MGRVLKMKWAEKKGEKALIKGGQRGQRGSRGFTLLELLVALSLFAVGILAVSTLFDTSYRAGFSAKALNVANRVSQTYVERLLTVDYQQVLNSMGAANYQVSGSTKTNWKDETASNISYRVTVRIDEGYVITGSVAVNKALVTVAWTERGLQRTVQYETYL